MEGDDENGDNTCRFIGIRGAPRDLTHKMVKRSRSPTENLEREREQKEELELSLGLSLNGRFGVDPAMEKIRRSRSVSNILSNVDCAGNGGELGGHAPLVRTSSLPLDSHRGKEKLKNVDDGEGLHGGGHVKMGHDVFEKGATESRGLQSQLVDGATRTPTRGGDTERPGDITMPYVSTRGLGPNQSKIEGFLYRYKRVEELKIVCVCHGMFLSPAEFVKHGGGGDVAYPLKHIVVNPFPLYQL